MQTPLKIFVGWDPKEQLAYEVCASSIQRLSHFRINPIALKRDELKAKKIFWRGDDGRSSTEFTYTRFLVPALCGYKGWAVFLDCDFLLTTDLNEIRQYCDDRYAVRCVHHDYQPKEKIKKEGFKQFLYPRKNWSSFVLWNCEHPANRALDPKLVNTASGSFLHRFQWLEDTLIGDLPREWNWLEGWDPVATPPPKAIHFTRGGPWLKEYRNVPYADLWRQELALYHCFRPSTKAA